jgi:hypothetical protein
VKRAWLGLLSLVATGALGASVHQIDASELEERLERRVQLLVRDFVGPSLRSAVTVYAVPATSATPKTAAQGSGATWPLLGYIVPVPSSLLDSGDSARAVEFGEVKVGVLLEQVASEDLQKDLKAFLESALAGYQPKVLVSASLPADSPKVDPVRGPASEDAQPLPPTPLELLSRYAQPLVILLLALTLLVAGWLLASSLGKVAEGIRSIRPTPVGNSADKPLHIAQQLMDDEKASEPKGPQALSEHEREHYLKTIEDTALEAPLLFMRTLGEDLADQLGARHLFALFGAEARTRFKDLLGRERLERLEEVADDASFDANTWLKGLAQRIELKRAFGSSTLERVLDRDQVLLFGRIEAEPLFEAARQLDEPGAWRVALEFLPADLLQRKGAELGAAFWRRVAEGAEESDDSLRRSAEGLAEILGGAGPSNTTSEASKEAARFLEAKLVPAVLSSIEAMPPGEDDLFLRELRDSSPELARRLRHLVWTPSRLASVEDASLAESLAKNSNDERALILYGLPEHERDRLLSLMPPGMSRSIVGDTLNRFVAESLDPTQDAHRMAKQFLASLRDRAERGELKLTKDTNTGFSEAA